MRNLPLGLMHKAWSLIHAIGVLGGYLIHIQVHELRRPNQLMLSRVLFALISLDVRRESVARGIGVLRVVHV